jgi:hypothetical protein
MMAGGYQTTSFSHDKPESLSLPSSISCILRTKQKEVLKGSHNDAYIAENKRCFCCVGNALSSECSYRKRQNFCRCIHKFITAPSKAINDFLPVPFISLPNNVLKIHLDVTLSSSARYSKRTVDKNFEDQTSVGISFALLGQRSLN